MDGLKPLPLVAIALGISAGLYLLYSHLEYFGDVSFLGAILLLEIIIASIWKYDQRFFILLIVTFIWAGLRVPLQGAWTAGRWVILAAGALAGFIIWIKSPRRPFRSMHLLAFFCVCAAFVSATVSLFVRMASLKALSLSILFLYCVSGARLAVLGREDRFFRGLLWGVEVLVYSTAACYFGLGRSIWGNPNSMGAVMSIACFPILLWGWLNSDGPTVRARRLVALILCVYLIRFSLARAGMVSATVVTLVFCVCLRQYKLLGKITAFVLVLVALAGMLMPGTLNQQLGDLEDAFLYKGHKDEGILGSRRTPWDNTISSIKEHPFFGTGYGTSPSGEDPGVGFGTLGAPGTISSTGDTEREHGSSYMTIVEWVGLLGVFPFIAIIGLTLVNVWKVCAAMKQTADPRPYAIPLAMVVLSGFVHANFEDWMFAAGSYLSLFFWVCAFVLADMVADAGAVPAPRAVSRVSRPLAASFGPVVPNR
ncbi:MAG TPA: O-antigen ligase family protein [Terriglobales bacterium]|jgi:O-antigen ligase|nr:O-antigen ligase family protein [Terriglobales bacterium]